MSNSSPLSAIARRRTASTEAAAPGRHGWLHLCNGLDPIRDGGMVPSILGMTGAIRRARPDQPLTIVTPTPSQLGDTQLSEDLTLRGPETDFEAAIRSAEVVHMHGLWQVQTRRGARIARDARIPYLITAHGMAEPWALRHKRWKKALYLALVESRNLKKASCLHALSRPEIGHLRALAPDTPVCFVPNGVELEPFENLPDRSVLEQEYPELIGKFVLLFFGRLHLKKGLDLLVEAFGRLANDHPELHIMLAGRDNGAWADFRDRAEHLGLADRVTYVGHVSGERARQVWSRADAFALPSYSEGFSMAILEALACRLPSLITTACHFPELGMAGGAIVVEPEEESVMNGLRNLLEQTGDELRRMAENGRALVERQYTWDRQARRLVEVYEWLAGGGARPEAIAD
ncbi:MAG: glycosyltransferase [Planctomycetes bacterium SCN 63-9]|nr:MAG: glycosyltransferase [Planctomycetes bacterium SCN 63-9]